MKLTIKSLKHMIRESLEDELGDFGLDSDEAEWAADEEEEAAGGDEDLIAGIEEEYDNLIDQLEAIEEPQQKAKIIKILQAALEESDDLLEDVHGIFGASHVPERERRGHVKGGPRDASDDDHTILHPPAPGGAPGVGVRRGGSSGRI